MSYGEIPAKDYRLDENKVIHASGQVAQYWIAPFPEPVVNFLCVHHIFCVCDFSN